MTKLRPDLQVLVDAELERQRVESAQIAERYGSRSSESASSWRRPSPVEPVFVSRESPLIDAINVHRAVQAGSGTRYGARPHRGDPWPHDVPFPRDRVVPPEVNRERAEAMFAQATKCERDVLLRVWVDSPWLVADNYGGAIVRPGWGVVVKKLAGGDRVLGFAEMREHRTYPGHRIVDAPPDTGKVDVGGRTYRVRSSSRDMYFDYEGLIYAVPVLEVTSEVRK